MGEAPTGPQFESEIEPTDESEADIEAEPPPPRRWSARADLVPVKGAKLKARVVTFTQVEGSGTAILGDDSFEGLKVGTYHLVVHESADCGKNAAKAGAAFWAASDVVLKLEVAKGAPASLEEVDVGLMLTGEDSIIGHSLVLHDDKKGKPGKAVACGAIVADDDGEEMGD